MIDAEKIVWNTALDFWSDDGCGAYIRGVYRHPEYGKFLTFVYLSEVNDLDNRVMIDFLKKTGALNLDFEVNKFQEAIKFCAPPPYTGTRKERLKHKRRWAYANKLAERKVANVHI